MENSPKEQKEIKPSNSAELNTFTEFLGRKDKEENDNNLHDSLYVHELTEKIDQKSPEIIE